MKRDRRSSDSYESEQRKILIIGHGRCGSGFMCALFRLNGFDIGHESLGTNGTSCWLAANVDVDSRYAWGYSRVTNPIEFDYVIHHVRDPKDAIPSIMQENRVVQSYQYRNQVLKKKFGVDMDNYPLEEDKACISYIYWNRLVEDQKPDRRVRVEDMMYPARCKDFMKKFVDEKFIKMLTTDKINTRAKPPANFKLINQGLLRQLNDLANRYGYKKLRVE